MIKYLYSKLSCKGYSKRSSIAVDSSKFCSTTGF